MITSCKGYVDGLLAGISLGKADKRCNNTVKFLETNNVNLHRHRIGVLIISVRIYYVQLHERSE